MKINKKTKKEKKSYWSVSFRWKLDQQLNAGLLAEQQACEKYGITIILIRKWRKWTPRGSTISAKYIHS